MPLSPEEERAALLPHVPAYPERMNGEGIGRAAGFTKAAALKILAELKAEGIVQRDGGYQWSRIVQGGGA